MNNESVVNELTKIESWPSAALTVALVIILGYCFRGWKRFPNEAIPVVVILMGGIVYMILATEHPANIVAWKWHFRNFIVGDVFGFIGWMAHNLAIYKLEDWLASRFEAVGKFLNKPPPSPPPNNPVP